MITVCLRFCLTALACLLFLAGTAGAAAKPAIVLVDPGASPKAFETYSYIEDKVRERFPDHEIYRAFASMPAREPEKDGKPVEMLDLSKILEDLKSKGVTQVAVQSLSVVPGEAWPKNVGGGGKKPVFKTALGGPLLSSLADRKRLLEVLAKDFPGDNKENAILLVAPGSPTPEGKREYLALYTLMLSKLKGKNFFFGVVEGLPDLKNTLAKITKSSARKVTIVPLTLVGDELSQDSIGDQGAIANDLLAARPYEIQAVDTGLGRNDGVIQIYLDHLAVALETFVEKKKEKKKEKRRKRRPRK